VAAKKRVQHIRAERNISFIEASKIAIAESEGSSAPPHALELLWWAQAAELYAQLLAPSMSKLTSLGPADNKHHRLLLPLLPNQLLMLLKLSALLVQLQVTELRVVAPLEVANRPIGGWNLR